MQSLISLGYMHAADPDLTEFERMVGGILFALTKIEETEEEEQKKIPVPIIEAQNVVGNLRQRLRVAETLCEYLRKRFGLRIAPHELTIMNPGAIEPVLATLSVAVKQAQGYVAPPAVPITKPTQDAKNQVPIVDEHDDISSSSSSEDNNEESIQQQQTLTSQAQVRVDELLQIRRDVIEETNSLEKQLDTLHNERTTCGGDSIAILVRTNERLKRQEKEFKASCRAQKIRMEEEIIQYQHMAATFVVQDVDDASESEKHTSMMTELESQLAVKKKQLAWLTRANVESRKMLELETFPERSQYEQRFHELCEQIATKTDTHKALVSKFNSLTSHLSLLQQETKLLESINVTLDQQRLVDPASFEEVLTSLDVSMSRVHERIKMHVATQRNAEDDLASLLEKQKVYARKLRELTKLCEEIDGDA